MADDWAIHRWPPSYFAHKKPSAVLFIVLSYVFIDTPGQIEVFTWSASGQIITETLASAFPTVSIVILGRLRLTHIRRIIAEASQVQERRIKRRMM